MSNNNCFFTSPEIVPQYNQETMIFYESWFCVSITDFAPLSINSWDIYFFSVLQDKERAAWEKARKIIADVQKHNK